MEKRIVVHNLEETEILAKKLSERVEPGMVILLSGDLGTGKTTFTQLFGKHLGVKRPMTSPTFNIIKSYKTDDGRVHHMDCYRLEDSEEDLGFIEYFNDEDITIIEWYNFIEEYLPEEALYIHIERLSLEERAFVFSSKGQKYDSIVGEL